jgi:hypothetical protein
MVSSVTTSLSIPSSPSSPTSISSEQDVSIDAPYTVACLCGLAYTDLTEDNLELNGIKFINVQLHDIKGIQFFTCLKEGEHALYIIFRGTDSLNDMMVDFNISRDQTGFGKIHRGFLQSWLSIRQEIISRVIKDDLVYTAVKFFGHSYGGALANIAAVYIGSVTTKKIHCQTFGCPRVGNNNFARSSRQHIDVNKRFIDHNDPIIHLPIFLRFTHSATPIVLKNNNTFSRIIHIYKLYLKKDRLFKAHRINHYIDLTRHYQEFE